MLDADMLVFQNMDELLEMDLPKDWIAANHACVCNWSRDKWALDDWSVSSDLAHTLLTDLTIRAGGHGIVLGRKPVRQARRRQ